MESVRSGADDGAWAEHGDDLARAVLIREFDSRLLALYSAGELSGTVHTCIGQEFAAVAVGRALHEDDFVFSNHRGHGHFLATRPDVDGLLAEVMGKATGVSGGVGGSQHLVGPRFLSNGIQAGMTPIAVGYALAQHRLGKPGVSVVFIGDGTLGEGLLYESLNLAAIMDARVLFVLEDNGYAQSTDTRTTIGGSIQGRAEAFGLTYFEGSTWEWPALFETTAKALHGVREQGHPALLHVRTYRLMAHSKGDDSRSPATVDRYLAMDPLTLLRDRDSERYQREARTATARVDEAVSAARAAGDSTYTPQQWATNRAVEWDPAPLLEGRHSDAVHDALRSALSEDPAVLLLGEDIEGPYGGAFKVTRDLSLEFPGRVINMPISEAAIVGCATGLALGGLTPVVEIMFGDFLTLTLDQLLQHASKFADMYHGAVSVPLVVRTPMGGRRGYGPTHSQSLEKHFLGIPGLTVVAPNLRIDTRRLYRHLIVGAHGPSLIIENKTQYTRFPADAGSPGFGAWVSREALPSVRISPIAQRADVTIVCYGAMLHEAERAQRILFDSSEIVAEIICPTALYPLNIAPIIDSVSRTGRLVVVEEGPSFCAFGAEVFAQAVEARVPFVGSRRGYAGVIPASTSREAALLVDADDIVELVRDLCGE